MKTLNCRKQKRFHGNLNNNEFENTSYFDANYQTLQIQKAEKFKTPLEYLELGKYGHIALGLLMYRTLINFKLKYFYEPQIYAPFNQKHPDGIIVVTKEFLSFFDGKFQEYLGFSDEKFSQIQYIIFDSVSEPVYGSASASDSASAIFSFNRSFITASPIGSTMGSCSLLLCP